MCYVLQVAWMRAPAFFPWKLDFWKIYVPYQKIHSHWNMFTHIENERHTHTFPAKYNTHLHHKRKSVFLKSVLGQMSNMKHHQGDDDRSVFVKLWNLQNLVTMTQKVRPNVEFLFSFKTFLSKSNIPHILICKHIV